jgi:hypothetical protein
MLMKTLSAGSFLFPACYSSDDQCLVHRIVAFFRGFVTSTESGPRSSKELVRSSKDLPDSSGSKIASLNTPSGPWVYTVVPWED